MMYLITYTIRGHGMTRDMNKALIAAFTAWKPPSNITIEEHVMSLALDHGFIIITSNNPVAIATALFPFTFWADFETIPVIPVEGAIDIAKAAP